MRQEQVSILQSLQARTQIKTQELGDRHGDVGVAVGIDGKEGGLEPRRYPITVVTAEGSLTESEWTLQVLGRTVVKVSQRCRISAGTAP
jgi:hypothetical protein